MYESASKYFNNSEQTHKFIDSINKIVSDKGYNVVFDNTIVNKKGQTVNAQIKNLDNGEIEIRLNPNSSRSGEFLIMHEVTHAIETTDMKDLILNYASKHSDFYQALENLKQTYGTDDVNSEVIADISGQLFGNQEFINSLTIENTPKSRNIIKNIYESIRRLLNNFTEKGQYRNFLEDLESKWREAYRTQNNNLNNDTKFMMTGIKGVKQSVNADIANQLFIDKYQQALQLHKQGLSDEKIRNKTMWFLDKEGKWKFEISDKSAKLSNHIEKNHTYKLGDILKHDALYEAYPSLKNMKIKLKNIENFQNKIVYGQYNTFLNRLEINNELLNSNSDTKILNTILHEIQHKVQSIEGFNKGYKGNNLEEYRQNLGEIEANDIEQRRNFTNKDRLTIPSRSMFDENNKTVYNFAERGNNENSQSNQKNTPKNQRRDNIQNQRTYARHRDDRGRSSGNVRSIQEELDNSSFSLKEKGDTEYSQNSDKWQEYLEKNYKATGTRTDMNDIKIPKAQEVKLPYAEKAMPNKNKVLNPNEISKLTKEDVNTTPILPEINRNKASDGKSKFWDNIKDKTNMLNEEQKNKILSNDEVKYYDKVTNTESLDKAFERMNKNGKLETTRWFNSDSESADLIEIYAISIKS